jgi:signal transduction histidine kinase
MSEPQAQQGEPSLTEYLAELEQENARLRAEVVGYRKHQFLTQQQGQAAQEPVTELAETPHDRILEATAAAANALLTVNDFGKAVNTALQILGEALNTDRVNIIEVVATSDSAFPDWQVLEYEWNSPGTVPQFADRKAAQGSFEEIPEIFERMHQGQVMSYLIAEMPEPFRSGQMAIGVKSTHLVPIFVGGKWWGVLGLDDCREAKQRSAAELAVCRIAADCIGSAIQREHTQQALLQAEQARVAELAKANEALARASERLAEQPDLSAFLSHIVLEAIVQLGADAAMLSLLDEQRQVLQAVAHVEQGGIPASTLAAEMSVDEAEFVRVLLKTRKPRYFDLEQEADLFWRGAIEYHRQRNHQAIIAVPLFAGEKFLGHLGLAFTHTDPIKEQSSELLYALAQQAALAIQLTKLAEDAKQTAVAKLNEVIAREREEAAQERAAELAKANAVLRGATDRLAGEPSLEAFLGHVLAEACQEAIESGAIFLYDERHEHLLLAASHGFRTPYPYSKEQTIPVAKFPGWSILLHTKQPLVVDMDERPELFVAETLTWHRAQGHQGIVITALMLGDQPLGVLGIAACNKFIFKETDLELFQALAQQATLAIQLTRLAEEAKQAAVLEERNRFARDMHDTLAQAFTGILMQLEATKRKITTAQLEAAQDHIARARSLASEGLSEARRSVRALRPEVLESLDLPNALRRLAEQITADTPLAVTLRVEGTPCALPIDLETNLLRIGQEALTNALRHAQAQKIRLDLLFEPDAVHLHIVDDGQGFDPELQLINGGFGLVGMQERSQRSGGQFMLKSAPGQGTAITVTVPLMLENNG